MPDAHATQVDLGVVAAEVLSAGFVRVSSPWDSVELAWSYARAVFQEAARRDAIAAGMPPLRVVGEFTVPARNTRQRDFQALHLDFGIPLAPDRPVDVARFTALYIDPDRASTSAVTRIVSLPSLLGQRAWVAPERLLQRLARYRDANANDCAQTGAAYVEGIFARLVEAADGSQTLPRSGDRGFLCGMEFNSVEQERDHFAARGLNLDAAEQHVRLSPGQLLLLDNLATAHGRLGARRPLELHQLCVGFPNLDVSKQEVLLKRVLHAFEPPTSPRWRPAVSQGFARKRPR